MANKHEVLRLAALGKTAQQIAQQLMCGQPYVRATLQRSEHGGSRPIDLEMSRRQWALLKAASAQQKAAGLRSRSMTEPGGKSATVALVNQSKAS